MDSFFKPGFAAEYHYYRLLTILPTHLFILFLATACILKRTAFRYTSGLQDNKIALLWAQTKCTANTLQRVKKHFKQEWQPTVVLQSASSPPNRAKPRLTPLTTVINKAASNTLSGRSSSWGDSNKQLVCSEPSGDSETFLKSLRLFLNRILFSVFSKIRKQRFLNVAHGHAREVCISPCLYSRMMYKNVKLLLDVL